MKKLSLKNYIEPDGSDCTKCAKKIDEISSPLSSLFNKQRMKNIPLIY